MKNYLSITTNILKYIDGNKTLRKFEFLLPFIIDVIVKLYYMLVFVVFVYLLEFTGVLLSMLLMPIGVLFFSYKVFRNVKDNNLFMGKYVINIKMVFCIMLLFLIFDIFTFLLSPYIDNLFYIGFTISFLSPVYISFFIFNAIRITQDKIKKVSTFHRN